MMLNMIIALFDTIPVVTSPRGGCRKVCRVQKEVFVRSVKSKSIHKPVFTPVVESNGYRFVGFVGCRFVQTHKALGL
jgi:hypothetical protein